MSKRLPLNSAEKVSLAEAATLLGVSKATLRNWDNAGKLSAFRHPINGYRLYDIAELRELQEQLGRVADESTEEPDILDIRGIRKLIARLHSTVRNTDNQSNIIERFDEITKLLFAKVSSDKQGATSDSPFHISTLKPTAKSVRLYYEKLAQQYKDFIPARFAKLKCSDRGILECVTVLKPFNFAVSKIDVKGLAYEEVIRNTFDKGDHQQFFTPPHIVDFIISLCEPFIRGDVCDPASGTGGFPVRIAQKNFNYQSLTAIEIDERLAWVSGINLLLHDAKNVKVFFYPDGGTLGANALKLYSSFDTIITNPPFGSDFTDPIVLETMILGARKASRRRGILFLERCHALLRDNGTLAIIIDEGVLNLSHAEDVRRFLTKNFDLQAVISLPESAFMPYATVNASIVVLRKRNSTENNTAVFFAKATNVGRKLNGDDDIKYDRDGRSYFNSDLPEILSIWNKYYNGETIIATDQIYIADVAANLRDAENGHRLDFQYHHPSRRTSQELLAQSIYPLQSLGNICTEKNISIIPSKDLAETIIRYTGLAHIEAETGVAEQVATPADSLKSAVKFYEPGDIIFAKMRPNLKKIAAMDFAESGYVSPECAVFTVKRDLTGKQIIDPLILSVLLRSDFVYGQIMHLVAGIGRPRISSRELRQILLPIPPDSVQQQIRKHYIEQRSQYDKLKLKAEKLLDESRHLLKDSLNNLVNSFIGDKA
jgi:type I restriction enzyme M protein